MAGAIKTKGGVSEREAAKSALQKAKAIKERGKIGKGLYANIHAKRKRGGKMKKKGAKGAPTAANFKRAAQTARKR